MIDTIKHCIINCKIVYVVFRLKAMNSLPKQQQVNILNLLMLAANDAALDIYLLLLIVHADKLYHFRQFIT